MARVNEQRDAHFHLEIVVMKPKLIIVLAGLVASVSAMSGVWAADGSLAPIHHADQRFTDSQGRIAYIVDLTRNATNGLSDTPDPRGAKFSQRHSARAKNLILDFERRYDFEAFAMTSYVGNSFTA